MTRGITHTFPLVLMAFLVLSCTTGNDVRQEFVLTDESTTDANCYTALLPSDGTVSSYIVLLPGFGQGAQDVIAESTLPQEAAKSGIAVFIPTLQDGTESYGFSQESQKSLSIIVEDLVQRYSLSNKPYCIGGFSMGGAAAVKYAENSSAKPSCVFAIDSPLDYERFCYATRRDVEIYRKGLTEGDSTYVKLLADITPIIDDSPYRISDASHGAITPLADIPVRYYIEPAEQWWLDNRQTDALGLNILDGTAFINDLRLLGNGKAELIVTSGKGYRAGSRYHPHSWSIVDDKDLINWISDNCKQDKSLPDPY